IADSQEDLKENPQLHIEKLGMLSSHSDKNKTFPEFNAVKLTHHVEVIQHYDSDINQSPFLPCFQPFIARTLHTRIFSRDQVDPKRKNEYQWVNPTDDSEISFEANSAPAPNEPDNPLTFTPYNYEQPFIKLIIPSEMILGESKESENAFIYMPAAQGQVLANQYFPFAQGDIIAIKVFNQESIKFEQFISNRFLVDQKGSEMFIQQSGYGLTDEVSIRYQDNTEDQQFKLEQKHQEEKGHKYLLLSEKEGLTLKFTDKEENKEKKQTS
uniref:hypothetical protein n=1 Tax=Facilibium subflavum TaxID=2219058 RepID=UPI0013C31B55